MLPREIVQAYAFSMRETVLWVHHQDEIFLVERRRLYLGVVQLPNQTELHLLSQHHTEDVL